MNLCSFSLSLSSWFNYQLISLDEMVHKISVGKGNHCVCGRYHLRMSKSQVLFGQWHQYNPAGTCTQSNFFQFHFIFVWQNLVGKSWIISDFISKSLCYLKDITVKRRIDRNFFTGQLGFQLENAFDYSVALAWHIWKRLRNTWPKEQVFFMKLNKPVLKCLS